MNHKLRLCGVLLCAASPLTLSPGLAQSAPAPVAAPAETSEPQPVAPAPAPTAALVAPTAGTTGRLLAGAEVRLITRTELSSRTNTLGERFDLEVVEPVTLNGQVVIPVGSVATGEVTRVRKKGMWGRRGILETRILHVRVADRLIQLGGAAGDRGRSGAGGAVAAVLLSPLIVAPFVGFFITGTSAVLPAGTSTVAYTQEDVDVLYAQPTEASSPVMASAVEAAPVEAAADAPSADTAEAEPAAPSGTPQSE